MFKDPVTLTDSAVAKIRKLMPTASSGLRIGLKKGGCAGMEYTMEFADAPKAHDIEVVRDGARVFLAADAQMFLFGTEIDYGASILESGFRFNNPNVAASCGCGESINFAPLTTNAGTGS